MTTHDLLQTTEGCRYCLMCRHVCPVTRVTYNEATSPHGWALEIASVRRGLLEWNAQTTDLLYQCADCGLCQSFCVTDQPLPYAIVNARADIVRAGVIPPTVQAVDEALRRWGNPYGETDVVAESSRSPYALFVGATAWHRDQNGLAAARKLLDVAGIDYTAVGVGRSSGYLAYTLGLHATALALALATVAEIRRTGCNTIVVLGPQQAHTFKHVYPALGVSELDEFTVIELTELLAQATDAGQLAFQPLEQEMVYHDACQSPRLDGRWHAPRQLLSAITDRPLHEGFWREKRAANCGASGGLPWTQPPLATKLAHAALADAQRSGASVIVTDAPDCLVHLRGNTNGTGVTVRSLYELLAEQVKQ